MTHDLLIIVIFGVLSYIWSRSLIEFFGYFFVLNLLLYLVERVIL